MTEDEELTALKARVAALEAELEAAHALNALLKTNPRYHQVWQGILTATGNAKAVGDDLRVVTQTAVQLVDQMTEGIERLYQMGAG